MSKLPTCCEYHHKTNCKQGRNCPVDAITTFYAETEGVMPMATGCSLKSPPTPAKQSLPVREPQQDDLAPVTKTEMAAVSAIVILSAAAVVIVAWQAARQIFN